MLLHRMTFAGLGPFPGEHTIDFASLGRGGIFLLEGPTGVGKSTIIDAVVFALYGGVAGSQAGKDRLVSHHLPSGRSPFVDVVLETGRGWYRVRRQPGFERPAKMGERRLTPERAKVSLWRATTAAGLDGLPVSTRMGEADRELREALGLSRAQFLQTVVLPQGEFATFLQAKSEERREILQSIFATEVYDLVTDELRELRKAAELRVEEGASRLRRACDQVHDRAFGAVGAELAGSVEVLAGRTWVDPERTRLALLCAAAAVRVDALTTLEDLETARNASVDREKAAQEALDAAELRAARRDRRREARTRLDALARDADAHAERVVRLDRARRAATCAGHLEWMSAAAETCSIEATRAADLRRSVVDAGHADLDELTSAALQAEARKARGQAAMLAEVVAVEAGLPGRRRALGEVASALSAAVEQASTLQTALDRLPAECERARSLLDEARQAAGQLTVLAGDVTAARGVLDRIDALATAEQAEAALRVRAQRATQLAIAATEHAAALRLRMLRSQAATLSASLVPEEACPVCGATEHPEPARPFPDHVGAEEVESGEHARAEAESSRRDAEAAWSVADATLRGLQAQVAIADRRQAGDMLVEAEAALAASQARAATEDVRRAALVALTQEHAQAQERLRDVTVETVRLAEVRRYLEAELADDDARVRAARGGADSVCQRRADLARRAEDAESLLASRRGLQRARAAVDERAAALQDALERQGLGSAAEAEESLLAAGELSVLEAQVREHEAAVVAARQAYEAADVRGVDPDEDIDIGDWRARRDQCAEEAARWAARCVSWDERLQSVATGVRETRRHLEELTRARAAAIPVIRATGLATADGPENALRMTLATFVVRRRFLAVLDAANERLARMSSGRYRLGLTDELERNHRRSGLALVVHDTQTGSARLPSTLSGGETFYASLALALGLADVVTAEAGGLQLGTLFVDEGFGSLDPHSLDLVLQVLADLRRGGRVVGVISHVEELKTRVAERVEIRRVPGSGTSTLRVLA